MSAAATPAWWSFRGLEKHADEDTDHPLAPREAGGGWGWRLIHAGGSGTRKTEAILNLVAGDLPRGRCASTDRVVLISPSISEPKYDLLADASDYGDPEASFERYSPDDEELPTELDASGRNLLILEDLYNAPDAFRDRVMTSAFTRLSRAKHAAAKALHPNGPPTETRQGGFLQFLAPILGSLRGSILTPSNSGSGLAPYRQHLPAAWSHLDAAMRSGRVTPERVQRAAATVMAHRGRGAGLLSLLGIKTPLADIPLIRSILG